MVFRFGQFVLVSVLQGLAILLLSRIVSGVHVDNILTAIIGTAAIVAATGRLWPLVYNLSTRFKPIFFPILIFALTGVAFVLVSALFAVLPFDGLRIDGVLSGIVVAVVLAAINTVMAALFADNDTTYDRYITRPILHSHTRAAANAEPGVLFLEFDGLSEVVLREAIAAGRMPVLARWLREGTHVITPWEPDLSSQTAASQAGILLGRNDDIPAFRWYDREAGRVLVSSSLKTAALVEDRVSRGEGLLIAGGASRLNMFSGDATDALLTFATIGRSRSGEVLERTSPGSYYLFFANPFTLVRLIVFTIYDIGLEWFEATRQWITRVRPRINRFGIYPLVRAFTTAASPEITTYMVISDIARGVPSLYATYYAYDEVAHHSGIRTPDAFGVLRRLDRHIGRIERAAIDGPRPYRLVVLSDHGQSNGATFRQRYGETLATLIGRLLPPGYVVPTGKERSEAMAHLEAAASEAEHHRTRGARMAKHAARVTKPVAEDDLYPVSDSRTHSKVVHVLASGNLGLMYDTTAQEHLSWQEIDARFPGLIDGLVNHPGIGFIRVRSEEGGSVVISASGQHWLESGEIVGVDPLKGYGLNAARHLLRHSRFVNTPDILINSCYWQEADEVAAFEELVGSHGGLGGTQAKPFILHPTELEPGSDPIIGTADLHAILKRWVAGATSR